MLPREWLRQRELKPTSGMSPNIIIERGVGQFRRTWRAPREQAKIAVRNPASDLRRMPAAQPRSRLAPSVMMPARRLLSAVRSAKPKLWPDICTMARTFRAQGLWARNPALHHTVRLLLAPTSRGFTAVDFGVLASWRCAAARCCCPGWKYVAASMEVHLNCTEAKHRWALWPED
jgi:hypothetical protein